MEQNSWLYDKINVNCSQWNRRNEWNEIYDLVRWNDDWLWVELLLLLLCFALFLVSAGIVHVGWTAQWAGQMLKALVSFEKLDKNQRCLTQWVFNFLIDLILFVYLKTPGNSMIYFVCSWPWFDVIIMCHRKKYDKTAEYRWKFQPHIYFESIWKWKTWN